MKHLLCAFLVTLPVAIGCGGGAQQEGEKPKTAASQDHVPANSGFVDPRAKTADGKPEGATTSSAEAGGGAASPAGAQGGAGATGAVAGAGGPTPLVSEDPRNPAASPPATKGGPKVSKAECEKSFDRYLELAIGSDPRLAGVSKEMIAQARAGATAQKGDPCVTEPPTRAQYTCAMAAKTTGQWESCMR